MAEEQTALKYDAVTTMLPYGYAVLLVQFWDYYTVAFGIIEKKNIFTHFPDLLHSLYSIHYFMGHDAKELLTIPNYNFC